LSWAPAKHRSQLLLQQCMVGQRSSHACLVSRRRRWWWRMWPRIKANGNRPTHKASSAPSSCGQRRRRTAANACAIIRIARVFKAEHLVAVSTSPRPIQTSWAPELELTRPISLLEPLEHSLSASQKPLLTCADGRISSLVSLDLRVFAPLRLFACLTFPIMLCGQFAVGVAAYLHSKVCL